MIFGFGTGALTDDVRRDLSDNAFLSLSGGTTHVETSGPSDGRPVVFVHGLTSSFFIWDEQFEFLAEHGYRVHRYDLFGRGLSDRPRTRYDADFYVEQLDDLLDAVVPGSSVNLVGLSLGGAIATDFTARHPDRVEGLFLVAPAGLPATMPWWYRLLIQPGITEAVYHTVGKPFFWYCGHRNLTTDATRRNLARDAMRQQLQFEGYVPAVVSTLRHGPVHGLESSYRTVGETDCPVEAVWSRSDSVVPYELHHRLETFVPSVTVRSLQEGCHTVNYDRPDPVNEWLLDFLGT